MTKKVVIWGHPPHTHTHSYIHYGFAKAFSFLDYDVVWYEDLEEYSNEDISESIVISEVNCCRHLPIIKSSKYFIHNISGDFSNTLLEHKNVFNFLVYHEEYNWPNSIQNIDNYSWYDGDKTLVIMWGTDLLPEEIDDQKECLFDGSRQEVNYIGSLSGDLKNNMSNIVASNKKRFVNYGGYSGIRSGSNNGFMDYEDNIKLMKQSYLNFDLRPDQHIGNGYIPCRIFKAMSYGCWIGSNSPKMNKFLEGRITTSENLIDLYSETESQTMKVTSEILRDNKNYIKENHTYINRINSLLSVL